MKKHPNQIKKRGGSRLNAGRKPVYGTLKTKRIMITIPSGKEAEIRLKIDLVLKEYQRGN